MPELLLPKLGDAMEAGTVSRWLKQPGEAIVPGEMIVEIETEKATIELPAREPGVLRELLVREGRKVPVGTPLAVIDGPAPSASNVSRLKVGRSGEAATVETVEGHAASFELDTLPPLELISRIVREVGTAAREASKVEVPFARLVASAESGTRTSAGVLDVPLGPAGARAVQSLELGRGTAHHALIIGRPGSGKTNLMHVIITGLGLLYPPGEVRLYLVDFKAGVGFKTYADERMPHARVIAIESEREFGLSVLQALDAEIQRRGELFRKAGAENLSGYRKATGEKLPRLVMVVDEFQEFFTQDDALAREAQLLLDRLVRQGRAFGVAVVLGTQTLGGYSLPPSTVEQIGVRIALQCSENDSRRVLGDDNPAARLLSRPGEAIYNAEGGRPEANRFFQVALLPDGERQQYLRSIHARAQAAGDCPEPQVFEGHEPAELTHCTPLEEAASGAAVSAKGLPAWLGEPVSLQPPTVARFRRQSGSHLLIVTREEAQGIGMLNAVLWSLAAVTTPETATFTVLDFASADTPWEDLMDFTAARLPHTVQIAGRRDVTAAVEELHAELTARMAAERVSGPSRFLFIIGTHRVRALRRDEDDYSGTSAGDRLGELLREGPEVGIHVVTWADTYTNLSRTIERRFLGEFGMRVAGPMGADESQAMIDSLAASRLDRPHRVLFTDEERPGVVEKLRPYGLPPREWLAGLANRIADKSPAMGRNS